MSSGLFDAFSAVDSMGLSLNWGVGMCVLMSMPQAYWFMSSPWNKMTKAVVKTSNSQYPPVSNVVIPGLAFNFTSIFSLVLVTNLVGLVPYTFTSSSHLAFPLSLALSSWVGYTSWIIFYYPSFVGVSLLPIGTPYVLTALLALIEGFSLVIRPLTLVIRLCTNMIAGHLILALIGSFSLGIGMLGWTVVLVLVAFSALETCISCVQAYVFSSLSHQYSMEVSLSMLD